MTEDTRFCKDCAHFKKGYRLDFCVNPALPPSAVSGDRAVAAVFCRAGSGWCGKEGRYYEERLVGDSDKGLSLWECIVKFVGVGDEAP